MATANQTARDKFLELRKTGVDAVSARKQAYWEVAPAQTGWVVQAQPVSTEVAPVAPAPIVNAPVDQNTGLSKPLEPVSQPVQPAQPIQSEQDINKQYGGFIQDNGINSVQPLNAKASMPAEKPVVASKVEAPIDYTQAKGREQDIINNLNTFKAQNMTPEQIIKASDYQNATPEKKALIEPYLKQQVPTASAMYNNIVAKADIPDEQKTSLPYKIANNRYMKANMYSTMTPSQLSSEMTNSKLIQGSQACEDLKAMNPKLVQDTENLRIVNGSKQNVFTYVNNPDGTTSKTNNLENTFAQDYIDNFGDEIKKLYAVQTPEQIRAIINTPDVIAAQDKATQIELSMNELEKQIENIDNDVEAEMKWSGATGSRIALEKASRKEKLEKEYNSQLKNYTTYANKANNLITQNTTLYTNSQAQKVQQANAMLPILQDQYKTEQAKAQAQQALNDPAIAIKSVMDEMAKIGVSSTESLQTKIQKANEFIANGGTIGGYIDEMKKLYTEKPEYKAYLQKQGGTEWQSTNITRYNPATGANESTPVFYRKKTDGSFEAVDLSGNKIDASLIGNGWFNTWTDTPWTIPTSFSWDTTSYIASKEWFRDTAYQDSAGVWTIGYGTTKINGKPIQPWQKITQADAQKQLGADIAKHSNWKNYIDEATLSPSQRTALASFEYNLWPWIWDKWAVNIINMVKSGDLSGAGKEMQKYVNAGGKVIKGLQNRRAEEAKLLQTTWTSTTPTKTYDPNNIKSFEAFNGVTFPSDYKTPAQQKQFREEYDAWRASRPWTKIEKGDDILNIRLDKPTEWESKMQWYASRMLNAVNKLIPLEQKYSELSLAEQLKQQYLPTVLKSDEQKLIDSEKKNFITAVLRPQSGASISPSEFTSEELKYFPQPWDSKEVIASKQNARYAEIKASLQSAWVDAEWNSLSKYYNPPVITNETATTTTPVKTDKITTLKKNYFN